MPLSAYQIVQRSTEIAHCRGYIAQAEQFLNAILSDLCQTYDFALARGLFTFTFTSTSSSMIGGQNIGASGPYKLPADYLRTSGSSGAEGAQKSTFWLLNGVPYPMVPCDLAEFDMQVQQAGISSYPWLWATDMAQIPPVGYAYPPPSGDLAVTLRYQRQMPDVVWTGVLLLDNHGNPIFDNNGNPIFTGAPGGLGTGVLPPWFPNQRYLINQTAGMLMESVDDQRAALFLGGSEGIGAEAILDKYLKMKDDDTNRAKTVQLDRRRFGKQFPLLRNTKTIGW